MEDAYEKRIFFEELDEETQNRLFDLFPGDKSGYFSCGSVKLILTKTFMNTFKDVENMDVYPDDLWIATFPRSGTTWTQEIAWLLNNNMDFDKAKKTPLDHRYCYVEFGLKFTEEEKNTVHPGMLEVSSSYRHFSQFPRPRHFKTHLHLSLLPPSLLDTSKMVYVARNPLDVAVSYYHHNQLFKFIDFQGDFKTFWKLFQENLLQFSPYFEHIKQAWAFRDHPNMLFLFYEDMIKDMNSSARRIAKFVGKEYSDAQFQMLCDHVQFDNMKNNKSIVGDFATNPAFINTDAQPYIRKGKVGGWREYFDEEMTQQAKKWIGDNLAGTLTFPPY